MDIVINVRSKADNSVQQSKLPVNGRIFVGRSPDCTILLDGQGISRQHLGVDAEDSTVFITDLSSNGTWLNGRRLSQNGKVQVEESDLIELPGYEVRIRTSGAAEQASPVSREDTSSIKPSQSSFFGGLTWLDKFVICIALISIALLVVYLNS